MLSLFQFEVAFRAATNQDPQIPESVLGLKSLPHRYKWLRKEENENENEIVNGYENTDTQQTMNDTDNINIEINHDKNETKNENATEKDDNEDGSHKAAWYITKHQLAIETVEKI